MVHHKLGGGSFGGPQVKHKNSQKRDGKIADQVRNDLQKNGCHFGQPEKLFGGNAPLRAFTDQMMAFVNKQKQWGSDTNIVIPEDLKKEVKRLNSLTAQWKGRLFNQKVAVRTLH